MAEYTADFELGVNGATIATGDPGSLTAWTHVFGTPTYSNAHAAHGSLAGRCAAASIGTRWSLAQGTESYGRMYLYATAFPGATTCILKLQGTVAANNRIEIRTGTGFVATRDAANVQVAGSVPIAINQWIRIEYHFIASDTVGLLEVKLFNTANSTTPSETIAPTANRDTDAEAVTDSLYGQVEFGPWGTDIWIDDILANATSYPGPFIDPAAQFNLAPVIYGRGAA